MATKSKAKVYKCETCGLVTTEKGHLCSPKAVKKPIPASIAVLLSATQGMFANRKLRN